MTAHHQRFSDLTRLLLREEALWRQRAFVDATLRWESDRPALSAALRALLPEEIVQFESCPTSSPAIRASEPSLIEEIERLAAWAPLHAPSDPPRRSEQPKRVSARKWAQIHFFAQTAVPQFPKQITRIVDWCAGKGHLARALHRRSSLPVTCIEHNPLLCETGRKETAILEDSVDFECIDALSDDAASPLGPKTAAVSLHACGRLNASLLRHAVNKCVPFLAVVPCCYQNIDGTAYAPLSAAAIAAPLPLSRHELRLPALDDSTAAPRTRALRQREHAYRLGVDLLHRQASDVDRYLPLGRIRPERLRLGFAEFAQRTAREKEIALPPEIDWTAAEAAAWERFYIVSALGLAQGLFRRVLESRLFLDRVLFLEENGYRVFAGTFCSKDITPRNLMLIATLPT